MPTGTVTLGKGVLVSRLLGFVRDALMASLLGAGGLADAFVLAFRLPNFLRRLLAEGTLSYALIPACIRLRAEEAPERVRAFARAVLVPALLCFGLLALAGMVLAKPLALTLAPGLAAKPELLQRAALFLVFCLPYLPLAAGAAVSSGLLLAAGDFRAPAYAPVALNLVMLAFIGACFVLYSPGQQSAAYLLCAGVVAAGAAQWLCQVPALRRAGYALSLRGPLWPRDPDATRVLRATPLAAFGAASNQINLLAAAFIASFLSEGGISILYFAERLLEFPLGLIAASLGLAALADLSRITQPDRFAASLARASRLAMFCALPAALGLAMLARPIVSLIFAHGVFGAEAVSATSFALQAYCLGLPALAVARVRLAALNALNALGDRSAPARAALGGLVVTLGAGAATLPLQAIWGPALAVSLAAWVYLALLGRALARRGVNAAPPASWLLRVLAATAVMALCVRLLCALCGDGSTTVALGVPAGMFVYLAAARLLRLEESTLCLRLAAARLKKDKGQGHPL